MTNSSKMEECQSFAHMSCRKKRPGPGKRRQRTMRWLVTTTALLTHVGVVGASSSTVFPRYCDGPQHVRIAVGPDPATEMIVSFGSIPSFVAPPVGGVLVGTSPLAMHTLHMEPATGASHYDIPVEQKYSNSQESVYYSLYYHHVTISGLLPNTTYYYEPMFHRNTADFPQKDVVTVWPDDAAEAAAKFTESTSNEPDEDYTRRKRRLGDLDAYDGRNTECPSETKIRSFRTAPAPNKDAKVSFVIMGDLGQYPHSKEALSRMIRMRDSIDTVILAGDLAYARMDDREWDTFLDFLDDYPIAETKPMQIVPGNHDINKLSDRNEIFLGYEHRFRMPRVKPAELGVYDGPKGPLNMDQPPYPLPYEWGNAYYAYTYGSVRFVMISAYSSMEPGSQQYEWIVKELSGVNRDVTPWLCTVLHTPLYNTFSLHHKDPQILAAKQHLEPLFVRYGVNVVFTGHIHAYLRTSNVAFGAVDDKGPIHVTVGAGGRKCEAPFESETPEPWVRVRDATYFGYGVWNVLNSTHSAWDWIHTGHADARSTNQLAKSNITLPAGPPLDQVIISNQYFS